MKTLILSPHLDDAVLSMGQYMAATPDTIVMTLFAGIPTNKDVVTAYDQKTGFANAEDAVTKRRAEDTEALGMLRAGVIHCNFCDRQYGQVANENEIYMRIEKSLREEKVDRIFAPLGINHPDHLVTRTLAIRASVDHKIDLILYEDLPGAVISSELLPEALDDIKQSYGGLTLIKQSMEQGSLGDKLVAVNAYKSQTRGMDIHTLAVPERFWRVEKKEVASD